MPKVVIVRVYAKMSDIKNIRPIEIRFDSVI